MKELIFVGRSIDNLALIFMDESGFEFNVPVDDHIKRSVNNNVTGAIMMTNSTSGISPKDIQTRIRRGESVQAIASENGVSVERIARYAGPAKRARQINAYYSQLGEGLLEYVGPLVPSGNQEKSLSIALREINEGKLTIEPETAA